MPALNTSPAALDDVENSSQRAFQNSQQVLSHQILRMNEGAQNLAESMRLSYNMSMQSTLAVIAQALLGSDPTLQAGILSSRSVEAQPQTTGQLVSAPPYTVTNAPPSVFSINPTTGAITKA